ncbi:MAG: desulfoferrodoxin [Nanoarchaeota archaeon]|nr:desulfoferrodoxin [Nanoarchaeota archaeon]
MTNKLEIYKCSICGNIIEILHAGKGTLVCCNQDMNLMNEHDIIEENKEKHVPIIKRNEVRVGNTPHPMEKKHHIEWIEATGKNGQVCKKFLGAGDAPEAEFGFEVTKARAYCNIHGLWKS